MEEILHQLSLLAYPIICKLLYIPGGCLGFLPPTVFPKRYKVLQSSQEDAQAQRHKDLLQLERPKKTTFFFSKRTNGGWLVGGLVGSRVGCGLLGGGFKYSKNRGTQNGWFILDNPMNKWMILGVPLFLETPIFCIFNFYLGK